MQKFTLKAGGERVNVNGKAKTISDCCMIYVRNVRALCAILIPSKIEQETDNHADQRGFCFLILKSETEIEI